MLFQKTSPESVAVALICALAAGYYKLCRQFETKANKSRTWPGPLVLRPAADSNSIGNQGKASGPPPTGGRPHTTGRVRYQARKFEGDPRRPAQPAAGPRQPPLSKNLPNETNGMPRMNGREIGPIAFVHSNPQSPNIHPPFEAFMPPPANHQKQKKTDGRDVFPKDGGGPTFITVLLFFRIGKKWSDIKNKTDWRKRRSTHARKWKRAFQGPAVRWNPPCISICVSSS